MRWVVMVFPYPLGPGFKGVMVMVFKAFVTDTKRARRGLRDPRVPGRARQDIGGPQIVTPTSAGLGRARSAC